MAFVSDDFELIEFVEYSFAEAVQATLNVTKEVLDSKIITSLWLGSGQKRVLDYVWGDVQMSLTLMRQQAALPSYIEIARVTGLNIKETFHRGQMARCWSLLLRHCKGQFVVPAKSADEASRMQEGPYVYFIIPLNQTV